MKTLNCFKSSLALFAILFVGRSLLAADAIEFSPYYLTPDPDGFYKTGSYKYETDGEGNKTDSTLYYGCSTETNDSDHWESDTQQNYIYQNAIVMPTCWPLDATDGTGSLVDQGYLQLGKTKYVGTDSSSMCFILSPAIQNLDSIHIEISPDVTPADGRYIGLNIEYSTDGGSTWSGSNEEDVYIQIDATSKFGDVIHMSTDNSDMVSTFGAFVSASENSMIIRFMTIDASSTTQGSQRCKIHNIKIYADEAETTAIDDAVEVAKTTISVYDHTISAEDGSQIAVFNYLGQTIGIGTSVSVQTGVYIVRTADGQAQKVLVK